MAHRDAGAVGAVVENVIQLCARMQPCVLHTGKADRSHAHLGIALVNTVEAPMRVGPCHAAANQLSNCNTGKGHAIAPVRRSHGVGWELLGRSGRLQGR